MNTNILYFSKIILFDNLHKQIKLVYLFKLITIHKT